MSTISELVFPEALLSDRNVSPAGKYLYVVTQTCQPVSLAALAKLSGFSRPTVSRLCAELLQGGWICKIRRGAGWIPVPAIPNAVQERMILEVRAKLEVVPHKGQYIMTAWLDYLVLTTDFIDNARPAFLVNPLTGERLEYDRLYPVGIAHEYMGPQHFGPTEAYPDATQFKELRARDLMKKALSEENGITLIYVTADDLTLERMLTKIPDVLPKRPIDPNGPFIRALEETSAQYRSSLAKAMARGRR